MKFFCLAMLAQEQSFSKRCAISERDGLISKYPS
nr:MAG TPA: hypothetical protein [Caudoviricetes sp.]